MARAVGVHGGQRAAGAARNQNYQRLSAAARLTLEQEEGDVERLQLGLHEAQPAHHEAKLAGAGVQVLGHLRSSFQIAA
jgi:hypothetical protein